jgi:hypothetical protein
MDLKRIFSKDKKKILSAVSVLIIIAAAVIFSTTADVSSKRNLNANVITTATGTVTQTAEEKEKVIKEELRNATRSMIRVIQSIAGMEVIGEEDSGTVQKTSIPVGSALTCTADRTSVPWGTQVIYTATTKINSSPSSILWSEVGSKNYERMYSTGKYTAIHTRDAGRKAATIASTITWSDNGIFINVANCPEVTITEPLHPARNYTEEHTVIDLSLIEEDIPTPEQHALMFPEQTNSTQEENTDVPVATVDSDTLRCSIFSREMILSEKKPLRIDCSLYQLAFVTAQIVKGDYLPPEPPASGDIISPIIGNKISKPRAFYLTWDGLNRFDEPAEPGDYSFVIGAKLSTDSKTDYSIQHFTVFAEPPVVTQETQQTEEITETELNGQTEETVTETSSPTESAPDLSLQSKCPGIDYPSDIEGHWGESIIKAAYDECVVSDADAGRFYPDSYLTRAEAVKIAMLAAGKTPNTGCYDADCGTPFTDLEMWQGPWIKAAYDAHIVKGLSENKFFPNNTTTRAESAALIAKTFGILPHQGCYTAGCGAGHPDNFFEDIYLFWQGPWIRALWDEQLISGIAPNKFGPDLPVTRAEFVKIAMSAKK